MAEIISLNATIRTGIGKGAARREDSTSYLVCTGKSYNLLIQN